MVSVPNAPVKVVDRKLVFKSDFISVMLENQRKMDEEAKSTDIEALKEKLKKVGKSL